MFICEKNYSCCDFKYWDRLEDVEQEAKECGHLIEVAPVVHGRWLYKRCVVFDCTKDLFRCSECNTTWDAESNYCPNCGAKMDGKSNVPRTEG